MHLPKDNAGEIVAKGKQVVTAAVPAAARAGLDILRAGGNAFDAAVAAALVETVWLPMKCGLAGDLVAICRRPDGGVESLIAIGGGPRALAEGARLEVTGPKSVGAAGAPAGYAALAARGRLGLPALAEPARTMALDGVTWLPIAVALTREAAPLLRRYNATLPYLPGGELPETGTRFSLPGLAKVIAEFQEAGAALFHGDLGAALCARVQGAGGFVSHADFRAATARWAEPARLCLAEGDELFATPLPTHGPLLLEAVKLAEQPDLEEQRAFAAALEAFQGQSGDSGTSVVSAADAEGNAVTVVHSNSFPQYGACVVVEDYDLVLGNRPGRGFTLDAEPDHWNAPAAGRIPFTTLHAWALKRPDADFLGATPGGRNQAPWNLQTLRGLRTNGGNLMETLLRRKWGYDGGGALVIESPESGALAESENRAFRPVAPLSLRSAEQILKLPHGGETLFAGADPRVGAVALGE